MTGAYIRVKRNNSYDNIEIEHLSIQERKELLQNRSVDELLKWIDLLSEVIVTVENS